MHKFLSLLRFVISMKKALWGPRRGSRSFIYFVSAIAWFYLSTSCRFLFLKWSFLEFQGLKFICEQVCFDSNVCTRALVCIFLLPVRFHWLMGLRTNDVWKVGGIQTNKGRVQALPHPTTTGTPNPIAGALCARLPLALLESLLRRLDRNKTRHCRS